MTLLLLFLCETGPALAASDEFEARRLQMVKEDIEARGVKDKLALDAMRKVPRHLFVEESQRRQAYNDYPLPIGEGQTISQPFVVALMTEALRLTGGERALELGTGSGYQAAVLAEIVKEVYTIEIRQGLYTMVRDRLQKLGYRNVQVKLGDGYFGWQEHAPFDAIIVTAAANHIPPPLIAQLKEGGRLIIPVGSTVFSQNLMLLTKEKGKQKMTELGGVRFVPLVGEAQKK
jgi:protein-L-isoaspartate(D-aspartate) O-methyltransferase